jgi:hypothetical protein
VAKRLTMISGYAGCGKTTFGKWLQTEKHFFYFDMDTPRPNDIDNFQLQLEWNAFFDGSDRNGFVSKLLERSDNVVIDWNYPPNETCIALVLELRRLGCEMWWFDGDRAAARKSYLGRGYNVCEAAYERQVARTDAAWPKIEPIVRDKIILTINANGDYLTPAQIWKRFDRRPV